MESLVVRVDVGLEKATFLWAEVVLFIKMKENPCF